MRLHHVQVAIPSGAEDEARRYWVDALQMTEVEKPEDLRARGGLWLRDAGGAEVHLGVEDQFTPARKAHPALLLDDVADLDALGERLTGLGFEADFSQRHHFPGYERLHTFDPFGNRVEVLAPTVTGE